jgi:zinc transporter ZupT
MRLEIQTILITLVMALCFIAPRISKQIQARSKIFLLIGTGGLVSLYFADLLPDVVQLGGTPSLGIIVFVWLVYSYFHTFHIKHHEVHDHEESHDHDIHTHLPADHEKSSWLLMASMISHCFSSGMLLYMSHALSPKVAASVFLALIGHKGYEALSVSVLLSQQTKSLKKFSTYALMYASSFPIGVIVTAALTHFFGPGLSPTVVRTTIIVVASFAVGSLAGCMMNDFLIPSLKYLRNRKLEAGWMLVGVALTILFTAGV